MILNIGKQEIKINDSDVLYYDESGFLVKTRIMPKVKKFDNIIPSNPKLFTETYIDGQKYFYNNKRGYHKGDKIVFDNGVELKSNASNKIIHKEYCIHRNKNVIFNKEPKILIATVMWKRHHILELFVNNNKKYGDILVVGSEGEKSEKLVNQLGCFYLECPNEPLGRKLNKRVEWFLKNDGYTHIIFLGSDNLISEEIFLNIKEMVKYYDIISWKDIYMLDYDNLNILYSCGYKNKRRGEPLAPGRCISKEFIKKNNTLWDSSIKKYPDGKIWNKIKNHRNQIILSCKEINGVILDIKTDENINSFNKIKNNNNLEFSNIDSKIYEKIIEMI